MSIRTHYDLIVIGGGPAGYSAAIRASQIGASVLLIEKAAIGGTCLNRGCIPTKFLWEFLNLKRAVEKIPADICNFNPGPVNFKALQMEKNKTIGILAKALRKTIESYSIPILEGSADFTADHKLFVKIKDGGSYELSAEKIIIAAGSRPRLLPGIEIDHTRIIDSDDALNLENVPASMLIIGGGAIGIEFATIFSRLGTEVIIIEKESQLLPGEEPELSEEIRKILLRQGIKALTGREYSSELADGKEKILIGAGRSPNVDFFNLQKAKVEADAKGIKVNSELQTSNPDIYAAGDITGKWFLAYVSAAEGAFAAQNALGEKTGALDYSGMPRVVFTNPPAASVGLPIKGIAQDQTASGSFPFTASTRAFIERERAGQVKIFSDRVTGRILGGYILGQQAENMIDMIAVAVKNKLGLGNLSREAFFHPSLSESIFAACEDTLHRCIDLPKK